ncbi:MAG: mechanosensitive ion channel family protein [Candidatus Coatesbacteria bacterium]|nr:mechanosensitive ion channel family protein [Candidatus Coatesbacteria bacterium]
MGAGVEYYRNAIVALAIFGGFAVLAGLVFVFFTKYAPRLAKKTKTSLDDKIVKSARTPAVILVLIAGLHYSLVSIPTIRRYHPRISQGAGVIAVIVALWLVVRIVNSVSKWYSRHLASRVGPDPRNDHIVRMVHNLVNALALIIAVFWILDVSEIDVKPILASLGISGIIVALALQSFLADLFTSFSIYMDKPFKPGDFVLIGDLGGTVRKVGVFSTRIQALRGEEIVLSNREIRGKTIQNFAKMERRRVAFTLGVTYNTPVEKLKKIPDMIKDVIGKVPVARVDRVHFTAFAAYSLDFEIVYYVETGDYMAYMDAQQAINLSIAEQFAEESIEIAYPTQTLIVEKPKRV